MEGHRVDVTLQRKKKTPWSRREGVERPLKTEYLLMVFSLDLQSHKFINAYAAFLKRQGKLPIPGM